MLESSNSSVKFVIFSVVTRFTFGIIVEKPLIGYLLHVNRFDDDGDELLTTKMTAIATC